jgi:hypothetical protein
MAPAWRPEWGRNVAIVVLLFDEANGSIGLSTDGGPSLARLGIGTVTFVRDGAAVGAVLEGWAFRPNDAGQAAAILAGDQGVRTLSETLHVTIGGAESAVGSPAPRQRRP